MKFNLSFSHLFLYENVLDVAKYQASGDDCKCQCLSHLASFREDLNICVDDIHGEHIRKLI